MQLIAIYILLSILVALVGSNRRFGFWGYLFASIVLTPIGGLLLLVPSEPAPPKENKRAKDCEETESE
ncbi:MAG: hypothetical protein GC154_17650 [bacterium]|nr:hypothetical protein [bacterium]